MEHYYALIMAGGGGTRLWPMSRKDTPKQLLPLVGNDSMFKTSVERLLPLFKPEQIYVVTGQNYVEALKAEAPKVPAQNFIVEPYGRDTAPAVGLAVSVIEKRDPQATIAILTADHHIGKPDQFLKILQAAYEIAQEDKIITLGISPTYPATGFGYIQQGEQLGAAHDVIYYVSKGFKEKPDVVRATQFLSSGKYTWNSGMFIWKAAVAQAEFQSQQAAMYRLFKELQAAVDTPDYQSKLESIWEKTTKMSLDFAIMENARNIVVIPSDIGWSDVGSWSSMFEVLPHDQFGNCANGQVVDKKILLDTNGSLIYSDRMVVTIGLEDVIIIDTDDALLICHKEHSQKVKQVVQYLRENDGDAYL